jgi:tetratricopeptide (TPR) repeat protein
VIRRLALAVASAAMLAAGCAPKAAPTTVPSAPRYPDFVQPAAPAAIPPGIADDLQAAWRSLQSGNAGSADRLYARVLKQSPALPAALAGQGYVALARDEPARAVVTFDAALAAAPDMGAALVGRGQALMQLSRPADALASFEAANKADPGLGLATRIETLRFRVVEDAIARARQLAQNREWDRAREAYLAALTAAPDSAVLYRELATVERNAGLKAEAGVHLERAKELDPGDRATYVQLGELQEDSGDTDAAIASYQAALKLEPSADVEAKLARARERDDLSRLPDEFKTLSARPEATRADLATALALRVPGLLARAPVRPMPVITDLRGHWARPWIVVAVRSGVVDAYPNHTYQPAASVTRSDLAQAASRTLSLLTVQGDQRAAEWKAAAPAFTDLPREHPSYPAVAQAVASGVMTALNGTVEPTRPVTGQELLDAVSRLQRIAGPLAARDAH